MQTRKSKVFISYWDSTWRDVQGGTSNMEHIEYCDKEGYLLIVGWAKSEINCSYLWSISSMCCFLSRLFQSLCFCVVTVMLRICPEYFRISVEDCWANAGKPHTDSYLVTLSQEGNKPLGKNCVAGLVGQVFKDESDILSVESFLYLWFVAALS